MTAHDIQALCVVVAGTMGSQIAMQAALSGVPVRLVDQTTDILDRAMQRNLAHLDRAVQKGRLTREAL